MGEGEGERKGSRWREIDRGKREREGGERERKGSRWREIDRGKGGGGRDREGERGWGRGREIRREKEGERGGVRKSDLLSPAGQFVVLSSGWSYNITHSR